MVTPATNRTLLAITAGGLAAAALDILYAFVLAQLRGGTALGTLQSIASGLLGSKAYQGGLATGVLGLALHCVILVVSAAIYAFAVRRVPFMGRHALTCGLMYGVLIYLAMNFVVLPLSAVPFTIKYPPLVLLQGFISHAVLVGLPISSALHYLGTRAPAQHA